MAPNIVAKGNALEYLSTELDLSEEFKSALQAPMMTILNNAEITPIPEAFEYNKGYDVSTGEFLTDLKKKGLLDSKNSIKSALISAVSVSNNILNTGGVILTM